MSKDFNDNGFGIKPVFDTSEKIEELIEILADPGRCGYSVAQIADHFNCTPGTVYRKIRDSEIKLKVKEKREQFALLKAPQVDRAVVIKAIAGDMRACELFYWRFEGLLKSSPLVVNQVNTSESDAQRQSRITAYLKGLGKAIETEPYSPDLEPKEPVIEPEPDQEKSRSYKVDTPPLDQSEQYNPSNDPK